MTPAEKQHGLAVPRSFEFHWAGGQIIEEASYTGQYTEPAIQLLEYEGHSGAYGIRFCYYNHQGPVPAQPDDDRRRGLVRRAGVGACADAKAARAAAKAGHLTGVLHLSRGGTAH